MPEKMKLIRNEESIETIRKIDSKITSVFISKNKKVCIEMAQEVLRTLTGIYGIPKDKCYLKGGNAMGLLEWSTKDAQNKKLEDVLTGDFDFQIKGPEEKDAAKMQEELGKLDKKIIQALTDVAKKFSGRLSFDAVNNNVDIRTEIVNSFENVLESFEFSTKSSYDYIGLKNPSKKDDSDDQEDDQFDGNKPIKTFPENRYLQGSYGKMISSEKMKNGRIVLDKTEIFTEELEHNLRVYANYTIPGFILYRLVAPFCCEGKGGNKITFKSEIIDISVPRQGSPESHFFNDRYITNYSDVKGFRIPGWGYHFYENINLLQEIKLGISGSEHKRKKREERLLKSVEYLSGNLGIKSPYEFLLKNLEDKPLEEYYDPNETDDDRKNREPIKPILSYYQAYISPYNYIEKIMGEANKTGVCTSDEKELFEKAKKSIFNHLETNIKELENYKAGTPGHFFEWTVIKYYIGTLVNFNTALRTTNEGRTETVSFETVKKNLMYYLNQPLVKGSIAKPFSEYKPNEPYRPKIIFCQMEKDCILEIMYNPLSSGMRKRQFVLKLNYGVYALLSENFPEIKWEGILENSLFVSQRSHWMKNCNLKG